MKKFKQLLGEVATAVSPADKEFIALHKIDKKQFVKYPETQFKGGTKKDHSKSAGPSNATGMEDDVEDQKPVQEEEDLTEAKKLGGPVAHRVKVVYQHKNNVVPHERTIVLHANDRKDAEAKAKAHVEKEGHKVRSAMYTGLHEEALDEAKTKNPLGIRSMGSMKPEPGKKYGHIMAITHSGRKFKLNPAATNHVMPELDHVIDPSKHTEIKEEVELTELTFADESNYNLHELSKKTLGSYINKAVDDQGTSKRYEAQSSHPENADYFKKRASKRQTGIKKAVDKLTKEDVELDEVRHFPRITAQLRSQRHDKIAKKDWEKNGKDMTSKAELHVRASDRYARIAKGKKPFKEELTYTAFMDQLDEARFDHREAATHGVIHPEGSHHAKVGHETDFYSKHNGDKLSGVVVKNDGKSVHFQENKDGKAGGGKTHRFKVARSYPGLHD